jgi:fatty acid desaturase
MEVDRPMESSAVTLKNLAGMTLPNELNTNTDFSREFHNLRFSLRDKNGRLYIEFLKSLQPNFPRVYIDITFGYLMLAITAISIKVLSDFGFWKQIVIMIGAVSFGYWIAYLVLFLHEAAHWNLARDPKISDQISNTCFTWLVGTTVRDYRLIHMQHHRALGTAGDSEITYFFPLNLSTIAKLMFGLRVLEILYERSVNLTKLSHSRPIKINSAKSQPLQEKRSLYISLIIHAGLITLAILFSQWPIAIAWVLGIVMFYPLFGGLRQILEHRRIDSDPSVDYRTVDHGSFSRMFGIGPISSTFGGAGFNRHLLHHWEPKVSYTNLAELEDFLMHTPLAEIIDVHRTNYFSTLIQLYFANAQNNKKIKQH